MKPHEQEWTVACGIVRNAEGVLVATVAEPEADALIAAAPAMARALLRRLGQDASPCLCHLTGPERCNNCEDRDLLRAAGVLR